MFILLPFKVLYLKIVVALGFQELQTLIVESAKHVDSINRPGFLKNMEQLTQQQPGFLLMIPRISILWPPECIEKMDLLHLYGSSTIHIINIYFNLININVT